MAITIGGKKYKVIEDMGYVHSAGHYAKVVQTDDGERVVVRLGHAWRFWGPRDRTAPLREAAARGWPNKEQT